MLLTLFTGFLLGLSIPAVASRFGKILPADPGLVLATFWHKPHFPQAHNTKRAKLLKLKWIKISLFSIIWGVILMFLFGCAYKFIGAEYIIWFGMFLYIVALSMAVDQQYYLLPDFLTVPLLFLGFGFTIFTNLLTPQNAFFGALFAYALSTLSVFVMNLFRKAEFGAGDVKMVTALGAWLGYMGLNLTLVLSFAFFSLWAIWRHKRTGAFGPALGLAAILILFFQYIK